MDQVWLGVVGVSLVESYSRLIEPPLRVMRWALLSSRSRKVAVDLDVVVEVDARLAPPGVLIALGRERLERGPVQVLEEAAPAALGLLERPLVERRQQGLDRLADFAQREERLVAQRRQNPPSDVLDRRLHELS